MEKRARPDKPDQIERYHECRIEVKNASLRTMRNVRVVKEHTGMMLLRPMTMPFDLTRAELHDLNPLCSALVPIAHWPHPKIRAGMAAGPSALIYGPIEVTVSGDDVPPTRRTFMFDWQREPMIYDA